MYFSRNLRQDYMHRSIQAWKIKHNILAIKTFFGWAGGGIGEQGLFFPVSVAVTIKFLVWNKDCLPVHCVGIVPETKRSKLMVRRVQGEGVAPGAFRFFFVLFWGKGGGVKM